MPKPEPPVLPVEKPTLKNLAAKIAELEKRVKDLEDAKRKF